MKREIEAITFDELVEYGKANGGNIINGMPWSFTFRGHAISHENDNCYLISTSSSDCSYHEKFHRGDMLILEVDGTIRPCKINVFDTFYTRHPVK